MPTHNVGVQQFLVMECNVSDEHHLLEKAIFVTLFVCSMRSILCVIYLKNE